MPKVNIFRSSVGKYFLILSIVPVILMSILVSYFINLVTVKVNSNYTKHLLNNTANEVEALLFMATNGNTDFEERNGKIYIGDQKLSDDFSLVDRIKRDNDVDITVFYKDVRITTTLFDDDGSRYVSTKSSDVWDRYVSKGEDYFTENIAINGVEYYGFYKPLLDTDGNPGGMIFAGIPANNIANTLKKMTRTIMYVAICFCLIAIILAIFLYKNIISVQNEALDYIQEIDAGLYNHKMNPKLLNRKDEYGMMCRYFVKLNDSLVNLIQKDTLTGLNNRRAAINELEKYIKEANTNGGSTFCLAIGDIDFFKMVNDTYGHSCGDEVLKMVSRKLDQITENGGFVARWGGEEFLIVMKGKMPESKEKLSRVFEDIKTASVEYEGREICVTMTFGLSEYIPPGKIDVLISNADLLLYKGKNNGRNQIVT